MKEIEKKISILNKELKYYKAVYPRSNKISKLKSRLYYYNKKLANL